jgi:hypothetical protein
MNVRRLVSGASLLVAVAAVVATLSTRQQAAEETKVLRHVVLFKFTDNSPEGLAQGFTHCFLVTFQSTADRDAYLPHAAHQAFVAKIKPVLEKALVVDYWAKS